MGSNVSVHRGIVHKNLNAKKHVDSGEAIGGGGERSQKLHHRERSQKLHHRLNKP